MKNIYLILSLGLISFLWSSNNTNSIAMMDSVFQKSNKLYLSNDFENAIDGYLSILEQGFSNGVLYYNIGNAYYRLDKLGYARLYYEKAKNAIESNNSLMDDVVYNINFLETQLVDEIGPLPEFFLIKMLDNLKSILSNNGWAFMLIIVLYLNLVLFLIFLFASPSNLKLISVRCILFFFPFLLLVFSIFCINSYQKKDVFAVLISHNTYVKTAPSFTSSNQFIIHEGLKFQVVDVVDGWSRVLLLDGKDGWVENTSFQRVEK